MLADVEFDMSSSAATIRFCLTRSRCLDRPGSAPTGLDDDTLTLLGLDLLFNKELEHDFEQFFDLRD